MRNNDLKTDSHQKEKERGTKVKQNMIKKVKKSDYKKIQ